MQVVPLHQPDADTIDLLRLLEQAEAGELQSFIYSAEKVGGTIQNGYTPIRNSYEMIGQLERMKYLCLKAQDEFIAQLDE
jgi:hypothetical protein